MASVSDFCLVHWSVFCHLFHKLYFNRYVIIIMRRITTDRIYDGGAIRLYYYNIILQYHSVAVAYSIQYRNVYRFVAREQ